MNKILIINVFNRKGFKVINYIYIKNGISFIVQKDYAQNFNISFNGTVKLEVRFDFRMFNNLSVFYYPKFIELSNIIPKSVENHIYSDGSICYAPPQRPIVEKWKVENFVVAADAMINNYFSVEYVGTRTLVELEHGEKGLKQYSSLINDII